MWTVVIWGFMIYGIVWTSIKYPICGIIFVLLGLTFYGTDAGWFSRASGNELASNLFVGLLVAAFLTGVAIGIAKIIDGE